ncbi:hypothetical protein CAC42_6344 [Sphaceloma murrayae]|uniref:Uncharacterized protein n=1 Tax=Sphaceloma murrayae TaxID=2082308 RepID=A0A2K1QM49_9PEZI|nr:hypothetical protein CAC42_6344 [Sphaceloma murrayae]
MDNPIAAHVLGTASALIPQIILNYRRHNATGLQPSMMLLWSLAGIPLGVYAIVSHLSIALQIQAQILTFLSLLTWAQVHYYEHHWALSKCLCALLPIALVLAALEFSLVLALRAGLSHQTTWPPKLMAVLAATLLALGVLRHYYDIYTHRTVRGISFLFCFLDALGDLTAILSIVFEKRVDVWGVVVYGTELVLWLGIFAAGGAFNLRERRGRRKRTVDEGLGMSMREEEGSASSVFRTAAAGDEGQVQRRVPASSASEGGKGT